MQLVGIKRNENASFVVKRGEENDDKVRESGRKVKDTKRLPDHKKESCEVTRYGIGLPMLFFFFGHRHHFFLVQEYKNKILVI